jgi:hypothetical protein
LRLPCQLGGFILGPPTVIKKTPKASAVIKETYKATRADDAAASVKEWDLRLVDGLGLELNEATTKAARALKKWRLTRWKRQSTQGFFSWLHQRPEYQGVGLDSMDYVVPVYR